MSFVGRIGFAKATVCKPEPGFNEPLHRVLPEEIDQIVAMAKCRECVDLSHRILAVTAWDNPTMTVRLVA